MKSEADCKIEPKEEVKEEEFEIKIEEDPIVLATVRPIDLVKPEPVDDFRSFQAEPQPSSSRAIAEVRVATPPLPPEVKFDPFDLAPRGRFSPPPPPADRARRRSVPGGHSSATPRRKFHPYQHQR